MGRWKHWLPSSSLSLLNLFPLHYGPARSLRPQLSSLELSVWTGITLEVKDKTAIPPVNRGWGQLSHSGKLISDYILKLISKNNQFLIFRESSLVSVSKKKLGVIYLFGLIICFTQYRKNTVL